MFYFEKIYGKEILKSDRLQNALFTTRETVIRSKDPLMADVVRENLNLLKNYIGVEKLVSPEQTHSANIEVVEFNREIYPETDALILTDKRIAIFLNFADCTPIIIYDKKQNIGAIAHGGWRGTAENISGKTVHKMVKEFGTTPADITALIGPCIGKCCFEVGKEVFDKLYSSIGISFPENCGEKYFADLKKINRLQLETAGVKNIDVCEFCTVCDNDKFFSYRKENATPNRHSAVLWLRHNY